jgi:GntR family transcriptional regulator
MVTLATRSVSMIYSGSQPGSSLTMPTDSVPEYRRVSDDLKAKMVDGTYPPGSQLPTKRELREQYAPVSMQVIDTAMLVLREGGWVRGVQGRGVYVADPLPEQPDSTAGGPSN